MAFSRHGSWPATTRSGRSSTSMSGETPFPSTSHSPSVL